VIERLRSETGRRDQRYVYIAVATAETGMGQAADQIPAKELGPERLLPSPDELACKVDGRAFCEFVGIGVRHRSHGQVSRAEYLLRE
jgi:hypothetical protein